jgi:hypothetical protein
MTTLVTLALAAAMMSASPDWKEACTAATQQRIEELTSQIKELSTSTQRIADRTKLLSAARRELRELRGGKVLSRPQLSLKMQAGMVGLVPQSEARVVQVIDEDTVVMAIDRVSGYVRGISQSDPRPKKKVVADLDTVEFIVDGWKTEGFARHEYAPMPKVARVEIADPNGRAKLRLVALDADAEDARAGIKSIPRADTAPKKDNKKTGRRSIPLEDLPRR